MKSHLAQLFLLTFAVGIGLWAGMKWFLSDTTEFTPTIEPYKAPQAHSDSDGANLPARDPLPPAAFAAPEPDQILSEQQSAESQTEQDADAADAQSENSNQQGNVSSADNPDAKTQDQNSETDGENRAQGSSLSDEERAARELARRQRLAELGLVAEKAPEPTIAIDAALHMPEACAESAVAKVPAGLKYRFESSIIRGESLNTLEALVALYRQCGEGEFVLTENPLGRADANNTLRQMRIDEVKYFLIQHSISLDAVVFPEN